ncbi:hypothetical protein [Reichenbachiella ulvae]|uniref:DUF4905 domain-containing protein n=1 Tax=Reichenbachiella ulvae TaxID=2980104 RepID=A0ABT3CQ85_9BACT|nr:hypothetical protein [Reichenbachiella ulvae]MCV9385885.1 hypothetical protein [Reichenbachiella ulvae]
MSTDHALQHLELEVNGPIMYMLPSNSGNELTIEFIDGELPSFYLIDLQSREIKKELKLDKSFEQVILKSFSSERIITQRFSDQNNPNSVEVHCFEWNNPSPTYSQINTQILDVGSDWLQLPHPHFQGKKVIIDLKNNESIDKKPIETQSEYKTQFPVAYSNQSSYFEWFQKLFKKHNKEILRSCEFLKHSEKLIISYYTREDETVCNYLSVFDTKGTLLDSFLLAKGLKGIGKDTFFVCHNQLIFVTGKQTLNVIEL